MELNCRCGHTRAQHYSAVTQVCKHCACWGYEGSLVLGHILHNNTEQGVKNVTKSARSRKETALARVKELEKELAFLARFPDDDFPEHTVLMTWKTYEKEIPISKTRDLHANIQWVTEKQEFTYTYVLLKANGQWWMTGQNGHAINGASWDKVIEFVDEDDVIDVRTGKSIMLDAETADELTSHPVTQVSLERPTRDES